MEGDYMKFSKARSNKTNTIYVAKIPSDCELLPKEDCDWKYNISEHEFEACRGNFIGAVILKGQKCNLYEHTKIRYFQ